ncbi:allophanate hydrolase [Kineobactrum sediminis]|uniref:Allophanate hydrolase n=1 Tax=Kineobactrum sediminis TaxID=1905677 RepID=A0A2N5Y3V4_9GAMM|nr:5-oxoprolinase subunit PxpB [Kineobactrum sediminis]PLW83080.1 allophanate hydrolase [Kineobactrum sediminis]
MHPSYPGVSYAGESAVMLYLGEDSTPELASRVQATATAVRVALGADLVDLVPSYASLLVIYDPLRTDHMSVIKRLHGVLEAAERGVSTPGGREVILPVYYSPETGADLERLAEQSGLSVAEVIALHSDTEYRVYAIGFAPGFAYLGHVDPRIAAPRLATPRQKVPRGSVAIADRQTAVYPAESPGGWNLVGNCPQRLFDPQANPTMPVAVGDRVRFEAISRERFLALGGELP